jgi:proteic killer suppression protein
MDLMFKGSDLKKLFENPNYDGGYAPGIVKVFRKRVNFIQSALDQRDIRAIRGNRLEKLKGRGDEHSIRLNDQWRLILTFETAKDGAKQAVLHGIEDYH